MVRIIDTDGTTVLKTTTFPVVGGTGTATKIPIDYTLSPGTGYRMDASGTTVDFLWRNNGGVTFPYNSSYNVLSITNSITNNNFYYFFYDWSVTIKPSINLSWSNSATTYRISGLSAGTYTVTLTDNNACSALETATEAVIRLLSELNKKGLINLEGKKIRLVDIHGLATLADLND